VDFEKTYQQLNPEQRQAVDTLDGPVVVLAGPGTGKTQLLSVRTANILRKTDLFPSNILILTFTNAGVKAMRERLARLIGNDGYDVVVETFHSFANGLISDSEEAATVKGERVEMTDLERITLLEYLLDHLEGIQAIRNPNAPYLYRRDIESNISALKRDGISPKELYEFLKDYKADGDLIEVKHVNRLKAFAKIYEAYELAKTPNSPYPVFDVRGRYDYDDMILLAIRSLQSEPELLAKAQEQYQYVMVDEFQDTNGSQLKLLRSLFQESRANVCVVGDDDQSIYRFQGASVGNFSLFSQLYDSPVSIVLQQNYRSKKEILEISEKLISQIPDNERVMTKQLQGNRGEDKIAVSSRQFGTPEEELTFLVHALKDMSPEERNDTSILVRTRRQAQDIIEALLQSGLSYTTDGKEDIRGEFRVQQLLKILKIAAGGLDFEFKDLLLFELLLSDFFEIEHADLLRFTSYVSRKKSDHRKSNKRKTNKTPKEYQMEESHHQILFEEETTTEQTQDKPSLFTELVLRFPTPQRIAVKDEEGPTQEETDQLSICQELEFKDPHKLHHAAWAIHRLTTRAAHYPVYPLIMTFLQDAGVIDYILKIYDQNEVIRLRELRSVSSFVQNLRKASQAKPGIMIDSYLKDLQQLETHDIPLAGEMVSSSQDGVKILTAHGSKGLEFGTVFVPFCIHDKAWPKRPFPKKIPLPHELMVGQELTHDKTREKLLASFDEARLFYVAATRAKDHLIFSAAPKDKQVISQFLSSAGIAPDERTEISEEETLIQLLTHSAQPDPVEASKETLDGLSQEITLSPSSVNTYLSCRRKFLYHHLLKAPQPTTQALVYGQCIHKALEKSYRRYSKESTLPPLNYFEEQFLQELNWHGVNQSIRQGCLHKLEDAKKWYEQTLAQGSHKPLELERKITRKLQDGIIFTGQFDKVESVGTQGEVRVIDYKTGTPDKHIKAIENCDDLNSEDCDDYLRQLVAYKLLYEKGHRSLRVSSGSLVFLDPVKASVKKYGLEEGSFMNKTVTLTKEMVQQYEGILIETWKSIQELSFERLEEFQDKKCGYCPYKGVCWKK
jgi:DNA helicase-2/ATP-dependent DNA helicase PcrA